MNLKLRPHSIIMMIGPTCCGKSWLSNRIQSEVHKLAYDCSIISSDECRRELLCDPTAGRHDSAMMGVSAQAFELLFKRLELYTTWPINHDFVVVDSTGLNQKFRDEIRKTAKHNHYNCYALAFRYKERDHYFDYVKDDQNVDKFVINKHIKKNIDEAKNIKASDYTQRIVIEKPVTDVIISII